jgi:hypothetical protein
VYGRFWAMPEPLRIRTTREFYALSSAEHAMRIQAAEVARMMRDDAKRSLRQASAEVGIRAGDVLRY